MTGGGFVAAITDLQRADVDGDLCGPFLWALPVRGVAISALGDPLGSEIVCASDPEAARLGEIQLDLGEGPGWEARQTGAPVLVPDVQAATSARWPVALRALQEHGLGAVFAFPMRVASLRVGSVDLYREVTAPLPTDAVREAEALVHVVARQVLHRALVRAEQARDGPGADGRWSRREVYQASGMIAAQTGTSADDALLLLRALAHSAGRSVRDLSRAVVAQEIDFTDHDETAAP